MQEIALGAIAVRTSLQQGVPSGIEAEYSGASCGQPVPVDPLLIQGVSAGAKVTIAKRRPSMQAVNLAASAMPTIGITNTSRAPSAKHSVRDRISRTIAQAALIAPRSDR